MKQYLTGAKGAFIGRMRGVKGFKGVKGVLLLLTGAVLLLFPVCVQAKPSADSVEGLNGVLDKLFEEMIPLAGKLIGVAQAVAGFGALWYIAVRVWRHIARAEPIDFYSLLRPFALGLAILFFLPLVHVMNAVLQPTVIGTRALAGDSQKAIALHMALEEGALSAPPPPGMGVDPLGGDTQQYEQPDGASDGAGFTAGLESSLSFFNMKHVFKTFMTSLFSLLYEAVALCINTIRTFYLIVLVILGPIVLGLSVFDGFQQTLSNWFARYVNIYMWLPVANIFGSITAKILENMMTMDQDFFTSTAYIIFMIIAIVGYTTVPHVAGYIVQVGSPHTMLDKVNSMTNQAGQGVIAASTL